MQPGDERPAMGDSKGLATVALIFGLLGVAFGAYSYVTRAPPVTVQVAQDLETHNTDPVYTYLPLNLTTNVAISQGQTMVASFTCWASIESSQSFLDPSFVNVYFTVDGWRVEQPYGRTTSDVNPGGQFFFVSIAVQYVNDTLPPGTHQVGVSVIGYDVGNYVDDSVLTIRVF
ncbi:MAG: hypothetical protein Kow0069_28840 [Promethearchaeota archaeon]